jgi:signal transduction histidine kinase
LTAAALITWVAIFVAVVDLEPLRRLDLREWAGTACLLAFMGLFLWRPLREREADRRLSAAKAVAQGALAVVAELLLNEGQTIVLLIIAAAQLVLLMPLRWAIGWLVLFNGILLFNWWLLTGALWKSALELMPIIGFQAFAGLTGYYSGLSERGREHLAQVNAELLATQRLLEESARSGERLKLSRELHDVAGHKLTALKLNLARLSRDPALAAREEVQVSTALADELLGDIRGVVSALRLHDGLELDAALRALARPVAGTRIEVEIEPGLRVESVAQAEALLRCAQEAITNALRHGRAGHIQLRCVRADGGLLLEIRNDGDTPRRIEFGNGLTGMRERLQAVGGRLDVEPASPRGVQLRAWLPGLPA